MTSKTIAINVSSEMPPEEEDIKLYLINALTNSLADQLTNGKTLSSSMASNINVKAETPEGTESVKFTLSGTSSSSRIENFSPYALFGDIEGNYYSSTLGGGSYTLNIIAYDQNSATGNILAEETISFTVSGSGSGRMAVAYPNPVKEDGRVSIELPKGTKGTFQYLVTNSLGTVVDKGTFNATESQRNFNLELSNVGRQVEGVYYFNLISRDFSQSIPLIRK